MRGFTLLCAAVATAFAVTLGLDIFQRKLEYPGKQVILYASMWAPGEPMQEAYAELFEQFEREFPQYKIEARWEGRWVLPAIRPRLLTGSDVPDLVNVEGENWRILSEEGYTVPFDELLDALPHPDDPDRRLRQAFHPEILNRSYLEPPGPGAKYEGGIYMLPSGLSTNLVFYNRVHYEALGLELPRTWSQFLANGRRLREAGYAPLASDRDSYADMWSTYLLNRAVGEDTFKATVLGEPGAPRFDQDPRYRAVFQAIRDLHQPGWYMAGWEGSQWPAAQRRWTQGEATHLICGSWIIRETLNYNPDPKVFRIGAFPVPMLDNVAWDGQPPQPLGDPTGLNVGVQGHVLMRQGRCREGAIELLRFISRRASTAVLAERGKDISAVVGAAFPKELAETADIFEKAQTVYKKGVNTYAPKWGSFVWRHLWQRFFLHPDPEKSPGQYLSVDDFLTQLQAQTDAYNAAGGEEGLQ